MKKILLILALIIFNLLPGSGVSIATIRYVSHNSTPTPPYTTWETAADSIQKCIDYCVAGDTIIVANGTYYESLVVDKYLWLIGSSMDSTIIDGSGLESTTVNFQTSGQIQLFQIKGKGEGLINTRCIKANYSTIENCRILNADIGIGIVWVSPIINNCIMENLTIGCYTTSMDTNHTIIKNSVIFVNSNLPYPAGILTDGGNNISSNNIIFGNADSYRGIQSGLFSNAFQNIIRNNIVSGFEVNIEGFADDTAIVQNNISLYAAERGYTINSKTDMRNNISAYNATGVVGPTSTNSDYNLYWQNITNTTDSIAQHDIVADPMFVNDTIPAYGGTFDFHLQKYSPAIDAGDPNILDVDGTRSDIGVFGGPLGEEYTYQDLAPGPPVNLTAVLDSNQVLLSWNRNTEADFSHYNLYRDTTEGFIIDSTKLISTQTDTFYIQTIPKAEINLYYKLTAVDSQGNESVPSEEAHIEITSTKERPVTISSYQLYQNYPNPFNPATTINYQIPKTGFVTLKVYDILRKEIATLVNEQKTQGRYSVNFDASSAAGGLASGVYIYQIRANDYVSSKKMLLLK